MPIVFWAVWMLVALSVLPVSCSLVPEGCDGPTHVVVDIHQPNYTVTFGVCEDKSESCVCSSADHSLQVLEAHLYSDHGVYELPHGYHTFDVAVRELNNMSVGLHHFKVDCGYECLIPGSRCKGKSRSLDLIVEVVDFELKRVDVETGLLENATVEEVVKGSHVTMMCSSGLDHTHGSNSSNIRTRFLFTAEGEKILTKSLDCDQEPASNGDWIVARQNEPPYDCLLTIPSFDSDNAGEYSCEAFLPRQQDQYVVDRPKSPLKLYVKGQGTDNSELLTIVIASVVSGVVAVVFVLSLVALVYRVRRSRRMHRRTTPYTSLTNHRSIRQDYGSLSRPPLSILSAEGESRTLVGSDVEVQPSDVESDVESDVVSGHLLMVESEVEASASGLAGSRHSTMSEGQEGARYYHDHMDINRPKDGRATPDEPDMPFDDNFECEHCGKRYRTNQRLYYKRHMDELETRCPKYTPAPSGPAPPRHPHLSVVNINISPISSGLALPNIIRPKEEEKKDEGNTSLQASGSGVESLTFMSESTEPGPPSGPSTLPSTSSSGPPSSVGQEGRRIYKKVMEINPATGLTPDSNFPTDPHYTCPNCGKVYHGDQRLYLVRHLSEERCVSCSSSSNGDGDKQEGQDE